MAKLSKITDDHNKSHMTRVIKFSNVLGDVFFYIRPIDVAYMQVGVMGDISLVLQGTASTQAIGVNGTESEIAALLYPDGSVDAPVGGGGP